MATKRALQAQCMPYLVVRGCTGSGNYHPQENSTSMCAITYRGATACDFSNISVRVIAIAEYVRHVSGCQSLCG